SALHISPIWDTLLYTRSPPLAAPVFPDLVSSSGIFTRTTLSSLSQAGRRSPCQQGTDFHYATICPRIAFAAGVSGNSPAVASADRHVGSGDSGRGIANQF